MALNPTQGSEINKTRPCLIISPDEMNHAIRTVIIAPMTTKEKNYPTRIAVNFNGKKRQIVLDQLRTVDKSRLVKKLGTIQEDESISVLRALQEMFAFKS